ncbi:hypothetical protein TNCT_571091 [Trichonephila clavata]|uniref:Uncharacterized protein n=1 Tax=Trichonephila clavata TaxID=2740835 RepID=A0A8X6HZH9_TRICU|nr:hypothetical protein TNCT_571091 [Trichonephila clavata]
MFQSEAACLFQNHRKNSFRRKKIEVNLRNSIPSCKIYHFPSLFIFHLFHDNMLQNALLNEIKREISSKEVKAKEFLLEHKLIDLSNEEKSKDQIDTPVKSIPGSSNELPAFFMLPE